MATYNIAASADDAVEATDGTVVTNGGNLLLDSTATWIGLRFTGVAKPAGATLLAARLLLTPASTSGDGTFTSTVRGELAAASAAFVATNSNISDRVLSTQSVAWNDDASTVGTAIDSPDLTAVINEIMDVSGWADVLTLVIVGSANDGGYYGGGIGFYEYGEDAARLELTWNIDRFAVCNAKAASSASTTALGVASAVTSATSRLDESHDVEASGSVKSQVVSNSIWGTQIESPELLIVSPLAAVSRVATSVAGMLFSGSPFTARQLVGITGGGDGVLVGESSSQALLPALSSAVGSVESSSLSVMRALSQPVADAVSASPIQSRARHAAHVRGDLYSSGQLPLTTMMELPGDGDGRADVFSDWSLRFDSIGESDGHVASSEALTANHEADLWADSFGLVDHELVAYCAGLATPDGSAKGSAELQLSDTITADAISATQVECIARESGQFVHLDATASSSLPATAGGVLAATPGADWFAFGFVDSNSLSVAEVATDGTIEAVVGMAAVSSVNAAGDDATQAAAICRTELDATTLADGSPVTHLPALGDHGITLGAASQSSTDIVGQSAIEAATSLDGSINYFAGVVTSENFAGTADSATQAKPQGITRLDSAIAADGSPVVAARAMSVSRITPTADSGSSVSDVASLESSFRSTIDGAITLADLESFAVDFAGTADSATQVNAVAHESSWCGLAGDADSSAPVAAGVDFAVEGSADWSVFAVVDAGSRVHGELIPDGTIRIGDEAKAIVQGLAFGEMPGAAAIQTLAAVGVQGDGTASPVAAFESFAVSDLTLSADLEFPVAMPVALSVAQLATADAGGVAEISQTSGADVVGESSGTLQLDQQARLTSTLDITADGTAISSLPTVNLFEVVQSADWHLVFSSGFVSQTGAIVSADWSIVSEIPGFASQAAEITPDGSIQGYLPTFGSARVDGTAESHTLVEMSSALRHFGAIEATGDVESPVNSRTHADATLFTDVFIASVLFGALESQQLATPDGSISLPATVFPDIYVTFHAFQAIATASTTIAAIEGHLEADGTAKSSPLSSGMLLVSSYGERFGSSSSIVSSTVDATVYGFASAGHEISAKAMQAVTIEAQGRANALARMDASQETWLGGLLQASALIDSLGGLRVYVEPPRVVGDLVSQFGTFYVGGGVGVVSEGKSKGIAYVGRSVGVTAQEG